MDNTDKPGNMPGKWWKIGLFGLGVLMIAGAVIYALVIRSDSSDKLTGKTVCCPSSPVNTGQDSMGIDELNWVREISQKYADNDFVMVILPGSPDSTRPVEQIVADTLGKIRDDGAVADIHILNAQDAELQVTADRLKISEFPAVLLLSSNGNGAIIAGNITETKLLQAYLTMRQTCVPGNTGCCPK